MSIHALSAIHLRLPTLLGVGCLLFCLGCGDSGASKTESGSNYDLTISKSKLQDIEAEQATFVRNKRVVEKFDNGRTKRNFFADIYSDDSQVPHGESTEYHEDGALYCKGSYVKGERDGPWVFNHTNGTVAKKGVYVLGKATGDWGVYDPDGSKRRIEEYVNGKPHGTWKYFGDRGQTISRKKFADGELNGKSIRYYDDGEANIIANFKNGQPHGLTERFYSNGKKMSSEDFINGKRHGISVSYTDDGRVINEIEFKDGIRVPAALRKKQTAEKKAK